MLLLLALLACGVDEDGDGVTVPADCNDGDASIYPGAPEICDGWDNDCDGRFDIDAVDASTFYVDADGDGWGDPSSPIEACAQGFGVVVDDLDCDDGDADRFPGAPETCDGSAVDSNCDGSAGQDDVDQDGFAACEECDDASSDANADAAETCNFRDDDCDGQIDEGACNYTHADVQAVWDAACTERCHSGPAPSGELDLQTNAYANLVGVRAAQTNMPLITPGSLGESYLVHKMHGTQASVRGSGTQMPKTGTISRDDVVMVEAWVLGGAPE